MSGEEIRIQAVDGSGDFAGYLAKPAGGAGPGVVVIQEIFGVNAVMRGLTDGLADAGYVALCPDLFWRQVPGIQLTDQSEAEWQRAFELFNGFNLDKGVADIQATIDAIKDIDGCTGKIGSMGFCLGGRLAFLSAARTHVDAAVGYYGVMLTEHLDEKVSAPVMMHIATEDGYVPPDHQKAIHDAWDPNPLITLHDYVGQDHAFARRGGKHYHQASADLARERTLAFFQEHLGQEHLGQEHLGQELLG